MTASVPGASLNVDERLAEGAPLQLALADRFCKDSCWWYHGPRQYLRALGVIAGVAKDREFLVDAIAASAAAARGERVLVSGAADAGTLSCVLAAFRAAGRSPHVTVADCCRTPLEACLAYACSAGAAVDVHHGDVRSLDRQGAFDLICTHSFIGQFEPEARAGLVRHWYDLLAPGGTVVTAGRLRPHLATTEVARQMDLADAPAISMRIRNIDESACVALGITRPIAQAWAEEWLRRKTVRPLRSTDELYALFDAAGFRQTTLTPFRGSAAGQPDRVGLVAIRG
ncbi:MAG: class I SAM-dependent methyltransferase [Acidobacteria bacterium]|nr:class I SAM-dependent methyltransferase [Acidobacteriota bacterium]